ncbi:hypothetical protein ABMA27_000153 [Loxostege sticticalis]|uniref:Uncharacterized protein n=1 Tax=Loxostege sticticalis TaxID=481309 RepID=A0ABR3IME8_LOXSC
MPKRKKRYDEDDEYIRHKIKKLERKLLKRRKNRGYNNSPVTSGSEEPDIVEPAMELLEADCDAPESHTTSIDVEKEAGCDAPQTSQVTIDVDKEAECDAPQCQQTNIDMDNAATNIDVITDSEILEIFGEDPTVAKTYAKDIQVDLALRLKHYATEGLSKEMRKELTAKYLTPSNCALIDPPALNAEIKAAVTDNIVKRDKGIEAKQKQLASAISALSQAITVYIASKTKDPTMLKLLMDTIRILCDCQHSDSITRKNFILFALRKELKSQLQTTKIDKYLFSEDLPEILKSAKAINRSVTDLKPAAPPAPKPQVQYKKPAPSTSKNWKAPPQTRRQQEAPRTQREPANAPTMRNRPPVSTKPLLQRVNHNRR